MLCKEVLREFGDVHCQVQILQFGRIGQKSCRQFLHAICCSKIQMDQVGRFCQEVWWNRVQLMCFFTIFIVPIFHFQELQDRGMPQEGGWPLLQIGNIKIKMCQLRGVRQEVVRQ